MKSPGHDNGQRDDPLLPEMTSVGSSDIRIVSSPEHWQTIAEDWDYLLANSSSSCIFLTSEWLYSWTVSFIRDERELFILCVYQKHELIGIAPFYIQTIRNRILPLRELRMLGSPEAGSDYLDVICLKNRENAVARAIYDYLFLANGENWDTLHLSDIPAESLFLLHFMNLVDTAGKYSEVQRCAVMPQAWLPDNADTFLASLSANRRERYRRDMRRLQKEGEVKHDSYHDTLLEEGLERFFTLYNTKTGYDGSKLHAFFKHFCTQDNAREWLQIDFLSVQNTDIAALLHLRYKNRLSMLLMAVDKQYNPKISFGNLLVGMCIQNAIEAGFRVYDFLKGHEEYKFHWATNMQTSLTVYLHQRRPAPILSTIGRLLKYAVKACIR